MWRVYITGYLLGEENLQPNKYPSIRSSKPLNLFCVLIVSDLFDLLEDFSSFLFRSELCLEADLCPPPPD